LIGESICTDRIRALPVLLLFGRGNICHSTILVACPTEHVHLEEKLGESVLREVVWRISWGWGWMMLERDASSVKTEYGASEEKRERRTQSHSSHT
jgi:hypothetical protein